jgi:hypothetical protein
MKHLVAFADSRLRRSTTRIEKQAKLLNFFDFIHLLDENNLSLEFKNHFKKILNFNTRGFGYWCWKPEIILNTIDKMKEGDLLLYVDIGCHLNPLGINRLIEYFWLAKDDKKGILAFQLIKPDSSNSVLKYDGFPLTDHRIARFTKGDLLDFFQVRDDSRITRSQQTEATVIIIKNCKKSKEILKEWRDIIWKHFNLVDDTPSISPNFPEFLEHRHDQAIWSLLCEKYNVRRISSYEFLKPKTNSDFHPYIEADWDALKSFPIHAKRDKNFGFIHWTMLRYKRIYYLLKNKEFKYIFIKLKKIFFNFDIYYLILMYII